MRHLIATLSFATITGLALTTATPVSAQQAGPNVQRDCQTIRTCNFSRTGAVRGCLSSFSCRACKPVATKCTLPGGGTCQALRCDWGG